MKRRRFPAVAGCCAAWSCALVGGLCGLSGAGFCAAEEAASEQAARRPRVIRAVPLIKAEPALVAGAREATAEACPDSEACPASAACVAGAACTDPSHDHASESADADAGGSVAGTPGAAADDALVHPTHRQTGLISANVEDAPQVSLLSFCLRPDGAILAACRGESGEVRVFAADGDLQARWELPVVPEAINVGSDGFLYVAGGGELLRLDASGKVVLRAEAPHAAQLRGNRDAIREEVIAQATRMAEMYDTQISRYEEMAAKLAERKAALPEGAEVPAALQQQLASMQQMIDVYQEMRANAGAGDLTDEQIEEQVTVSMEYKLGAASISEAQGDVFLASHASAGYGFCVWRMNREFAEAEVIVNDLRGCCGQMDVQAGATGIYVAENSRHRVCAFDRSGAMQAEWGEQARDGLEGFGSCCNPMNVAFGGGDSVYTAESETGRIKRFDAAGNFLELVGKADLVPGCKKVAIGVDAQHDRVYMLDITRHHIVKLERLQPGEQVAYRETRSGATPPEEEAGASRGVGATLLKALFGL